MTLPRFIAAASDRFPAALRHVQAPVRGLWVLGPDPDDDRLVAIVGTRRPTPYGVEVARSIARDLAVGGVTVVSGLAVGIDTAAHVGALSGDGRTIAVLAGGVDVPMPPQNGRLYREILERGGSVISEQPPGERAYKGRYLERNRIIAALCSAVVVVQAGARSGATSTANRALDFGTELFAVPGDIRADASVGVHDLLKRHAHVCTAATDVFEVLGWEPRQGGPSVTSPDAVILEAVRAGAATLDALVERTGHPVPALLRALGALELRGHLVCAGARYIPRI